MRQRKQEKEKQGDERRVRESEYIIRHSTKTQTMETQLPVSKGAGVMISLTKTKAAFLLRISTLLVTSRSVTIPVHKFDFKEERVTIVRV